MREAGHHAQRLLQIVGGHVGELLQLLVGAGQFLGRLPQGVFGLFALGDVPEHDDDADDVLLLDDGGRAEFHRKRGSILAHEFLRDPLSHPVEGQLRVDGTFLHGIRLVVGARVMKRRMGVASNQRGRVPAEQLRPKGVHERDPTVQAQAADSFLDRLQDQIILALVRASSAVPLDQLLQVIAMPFELQFAVQARKPYPPSRPRRGRRPRAPSAGGRPPGGRSA